MKLPMTHLRLHFGIFIIASFLSGVLCQYEELDQENPDCSEKALFSCAYPADFETLKLIKSQKELDDMCENFNEGIRCIDEYAKRCLEPHQRSHFNTLYSGTSMVMHELCTPGPYQKEYLKHTGCMSNATDQFEHCIRQFQLSIEQEEKKTHKDQTSVERVCCSLASYLSCSKTVVRATCGEESETFAAGFLDKMSKAINNEHCSNITLSSEVCSGVDTHYSSHMALIFTILLTTYSYLFSY